MSHIAILLITALIVPSAFAASDAHQAFDAGKAAFLAGDVEKAVELLEKAVELKPDDAQNYYWLGNAYGRKARAAGPLTQARMALKTRDAFETAVKLNPGYQDARFGLIEFYLLAPALMGGGEGKAIAQANELRKIDRLAGHRAWSRIYRHQKKNAAAHNEMVAAVREQPDSPLAHYHLAISFLSDKNYGAAMESFERTLALDPLHADAWFRIGQTSASGSINYPRGEELLRRYLGTNPDSDSPPLARAWYWLGMIQEKQGRKAEAKASYQMSLRLHGRSKDAAEALKRVS